MGAGVGEQIDDILALAGSSRPRLERLLVETAEYLVENRLVVDRKTWATASQDDAFAFRFLTTLFGDKEWDSVHLFDEPALSALRSVNRRAHEWAKTSGGRRYFERVADAQGGRFCALCGAGGPLVVDHVVPVNQGGDRDAVANMQILCNSCNSAKGALADRLIPAAVSQVTDHSAAT